MSNARLDGFPTWLRQIDAALPVTSLFIVHGQIRDLHLIPLPGRPLRPRRSTEALWDALQASGYKTLLYYSSLHGLTATPDTEAAANEVLGPLRSSLGSKIDHESLADICAAVAGNQSVRAGIVVDYLSQADPEPGTEALALATLRIVHESRGHRHDGERKAALRNPVFWFLDQPADAPSWLLHGDGIRQVPIPAPDLEARQQAAGLLVGSLPGRGSGHFDPVSAAARFAEATDGLSLRSMFEVVQLTVDTGAGAERIEDSVRTYRVGLAEDPWTRPYLRKRIGNGEAFLASRVKGQPAAIRHALDILVRSVTGLAGAQSRSIQAGPKGVLFLAGPTGVGKTELAKALTRLVFGDDSAFIRFDMSEFASEHAEARLIGSPPGYEGHRSGGELTNAVRQRPFSVVLFDEIEKAHPKILDKFLQILGDGRLTDGSGDTVYFSETLIVFTSNLGMAGRSAPPPGECSHAGFEEDVKAAIRDEFEHRLHRPELLGRIGDNIVVFDYLDPGTATELAAGYIANVCRRTGTSLGITLEVADDARDAIIAHAIADLSKGGRGVGLQIESLFVNPLARALFGRDRGSSARVTAFERDPSGSPRITVQ